MNISKTRKMLVVIMILFCVNFVSAISVDINFITIYPGEEGEVTIEIENNGNFDIEDVSISLVLASITQIGEIISLPFTIVGSSEEEIDDLDEDDDDKARFMLRAATDIKPGDYNIPYVLKYYEEGENDEIHQEGSFGIRVSAKTEIDFVVEAENNIIGKQGKISLEIINMGLGDLRSVSVEIFPQGFELISKEKIFVGTVDSEDFEVVDYDVLFNKQNPVLTAKIDYKDFENKDNSEIIEFPVKVYTQEEAIKLGLIKTSKTGIYIGIGIALLIVWFVYRKIRKRNKNNKRRK